MKMPPTIPKIFKLSESDKDIENLLIPQNNNTSKGNSTNVCPIAILNPIFDPYLLPYNKFTKNNGPGDNTPDVETRTT